MREYLFSYTFRGERYSLTVEAQSPAEAAMRVEAMGRADYDGEMILTVPVAPKWFARWFRQ